VIKPIGFLLIAASSGLLQANVIYTNFGVSPAAPFDSTSGVTVAASGNDLSTAFSFAVSPLSSYVVTEIDFAASFNGGTNSIAATIYQDGGGVPGTAVYTTGFLNNAMGSFSSPVELAVPVNSGPVLNAGATYWLSLDATSDSIVRWNYNGLGVTGNGALFQSGAWSNSQRELGAFQIDGAVASPEPATLALFGAGLAVLALVRFRRANN
jgi:hypothetical protein